MTPDELEQVYQRRRREAEAIDPKLDKLNEELLRTAKPTEVYYTRVKHNPDSSVGVQMTESTSDYKWMDNIQWEFFDRAAVNGPTMCRVAVDPNNGRKYYYSTFRKPGGTTVLLITELPQDPPEDDEPVVLAR